MGDIMNKTNLKKEYEMVKNIYEPTLYRDFMKYYCKINELETANANTDKFRVAFVCWIKGKEQQIQEIKNQKNSLYYAYLKILEAIEPLKSKIETPTPELEMEEMDKFDKLWDC